MRIPLLAFALPLVALASPPASADKPAGVVGVIGKVQSEIPLADGTILRQAKIMDCSLDRGTAIVAEANRIRTVSLQELPAALREQVVAEARQAPPRRIYPYSRPETRPPPPPDKVIVDAPPAPTGVPATAVDELVQRATTAAPDELKFYLTKANDRLASLTTKVRTAEQVPGWQRIRVSGDASFSQWDQSRRDYVWRTEKFEVSFDIVNGRDLKIATVAFGGFPRTVE